MRSMPGRATWAAPGIPGILISFHFRPPQPPANNPHTPARTPPTMALALPPRGALRTKCTSPKSATQSCTQSTFPFHELRPELQELVARQMDPDTRLSFRATARAPRAMATKPTDRTSHDIVKKFLGRPRTFVVTESTFPLRAHYDAAGLAGALTAMARDCRDRLELPDSRWLTYAAYPLPKGTSMFRATARLEARTKLPQYLGSGVAVEVTAARGVHGGVVVKEFYDITLRYVLPTGKSSRRLMSVQYSHNPRRDGGRAPADQMTEYVFAPKTLVTLRKAQGNHARELLPLLLLAWRRAFPELGGGFAAVHCDKAHGVEDVVQHFLGHPAVYYTRS